MIHKALRLIRQYHQDSQSALANNLGISKDKLSAIESNKFPVSESILESYSRIYDIPVSSLVFFSESIGSEGKHAKKIRKVLAGKVLDILTWVSKKNAKK